MGLTRWEIYRSAVLRTHRLLGLNFAWMVLSQELVCLSSLNDRSDMITSSGGCLDQPWARGEGDCTECLWTQP